MTIFETLDRPQRILHREKQARRNFYAIYTAPDLDAAIQAIDETVHQLTRLSDLLAARRLTHGPMPPAA